MARHGSTSSRSPIILAIENSGLCCSVAIVATDGLIAEISLISQTTHSKRLLSTIDQVMRDAGLDWPGIDAIAISLGPGSFTGLRIGVATAKGLAMATAKPLVGIASLDGLAWQIAATGLPVCAVMDARKQEVFAAFYRIGLDGQPERTSDYLAIRPLDLISRISAETILVGDAIGVYGDLFREHLGDCARFASPRLFHPRAAAIAAAAMPRWQAGEFLDPALAAPLYIRASDAELSFGLQTPYPS